MVLARPVLVDDQHPAPGPEDDPHPRPPPGQLWTERRELAQRLERGPDPGVGFCGKRVRDDQAVEDSDRCGRELDPGHRSQVVERDRLTVVGLAAPELGALEGAVDPVEHGDDVVRIRVGFIDGARQQQADQRAFVDVDAFREPRELGGVLVIEGDVGSRVNDGRYRAVRLGARG